MAKSRTEGVATVIQDVEKLAKELRVDLRKRMTATGLPKRLEQAAMRLRKRAISAAEQVEKYVHQLRKDLERGMKKPAKPRRRRAAKPAAHHRQPPPLLE